MALNEYLHSHTSFRNEIEKRTGTVEGIEDTAQSGSMNGDCDDDVDVPSSSVIRDALGLTVSGSDSGTSGCVSQVRKDSEHRGLVAAGQEENVWAWNNGEKWGDDMPTEEDDD